MGYLGELDANYGKFAPYISRVPITVPLLEGWRLAFAVPVRGTLHTGRSCVYPRIHFFREYSLKSGFVKVVNYVFDP